MGELIAGTWQRNGFASTVSDGTIKRKPAVFRSWITSNSDGFEGTADFPATAGRYHLYVSLACP